MLYCGQAGKHKYTGDRLASETFLEFPRYDCNDLMTENSEE
jgi:hypothetical protein